MLVLWLGSDVMKRLMILTTCAAGTVLLAASGAAAQSTEPTTPAPSQSAPAQASSTPVQASSAPSTPSAPEAVTTTSNFARDRNVSVRERPRPGYEEIGAHVGAFSIYPRIAASAGYDSNVYATQSDTVSDEVFVVTPQVSAQSNWGRNSLSAFARAALTRYASNTRENTDEYAFGVNGRLDVQRGSAISAASTFSHNEEALTAPTAPTAASRPVPYNQWQASVAGVDEINRLRLATTVSVNQLDYQNVPDQSGGLLFQNDRDRIRWAENGRVEYAVSPATSLYVSGTFNQTQYRLKPPRASIDRDSSGWDAAVGANFDLTNLARGEVQIGYQSQDYKDPAFKNTNSLSFQGSVEWFPTQLTTVTATASRSIEETPVAGASGFVYTVFNLRADHELRRNILLTPSIGYGLINYRGVDRTDKRPSAGVTATYLLNRLVGVSLGYTFLKVTSTGVARTNNYTDSRASASLTLQF